MHNQSLTVSRFGNPGEVLSLAGTPLPAAGQKLRIEMLYAPINPSDLIPITGAYRHRTMLPFTPGYEGVGKIVAAPDRTLIGQRVLPLRGNGTWQRYIDCDPAWVVPVPDTIDDSLAARAYINPLTVKLMLQEWPVRGKTIMLTAAGSSCARLLAHQALKAGAGKVVGIYRSPQHRQALSAIGVLPVDVQNNLQVMHELATTDLVFDALGGTVAHSILAALPPHSQLVSYGWLSGETRALLLAGHNVATFRLKTHIDAASAEQWQRWFNALWPEMKGLPLPEIRPYGLSEWHQALAAFYTPGRAFKPVFTPG